MARGSEGLNPRTPTELNHPELNAKETLNPEQPCTQTQPEATPTPNKYTPLRERTRVTPWVKGGTLDPLSTQNFLETLEPCMQAKLVHFSI